ncbi:calcium-binding protein : VCBS repeat-containing protein OS=Synechococcus sp. PCC 7502 GN=Syn7502_00897 PE=4 SV=1: HemolysinCabind: HemolysinCabind: HemolysinCabind [Gemmata massiliana]|uniref:Uncharacterized protein n=1 Tax=Gemmata massiliana TaxID=1210884 RepID=A0A6P2D2X1_9BACT|nr:calcium-binding protein [Gemmata massiliana]VTR95217.1 calcium-binding protein : VCBS repeat-containing protein OS=Synechococcus sp. PCC 7502 GN=Syn7502_00897 PE=4 SV=1: HemolysinCabind: HemolysinCabind: HemolysinCabind [Gemmata massiliana]
MRSALRSLATRLAPRPAPPFKLGLEHLETREVPALTTPNIFNPSATLVINADANGTNNVVVTRENHALLGPGALFVRNNGNLSMVFGTVPSAAQPIAIKTIVFNGSSNGDVFRNSTNVPSTLFGNGGNDTLIGGSGADTISGGTGNDAIDGGDLLNINTFTEASAGVLTLADPAPGQTSATMTGVGTDLFLRISNVVLTGNLTADTFDLTRYSGAVTANGGDGNDTFLLGPGAAAIDGGNNTSAGDSIVLDGVDTASFDGTALLARGRRYAFSNVERVRLVGTAGNDSFDMVGFPPVELTIESGAGDDIIRGGSGANIIKAGTGTNTIIPSNGIDFAANLEGGQNIPATLLTRQLTPAELSATGGQPRVLLRGTGSEQLLDVFGPTRAGFSIQGNWQRVLIGGAERFTASGTVTLKTALGDLPFVVPSSAPLTIQTAADAMSNFGTVTGLSWFGSALNTTDPQSPLAFFSQQYGLDVSIRTVNWSLALGRDIPGASSMPINPAVPYLYAVVADGYAASFAGRSASRGGLTVVFDPSDPSLFVRSDLLLNAAISAKGYVPFRARQVVPGDQGFYGNLATYGGAALGISAITIGGDLVFDFDLNGDGIGVAVTPERVQKLVNQSMTLKTLAGTAIDDVAFGANGSNFNVDAPQPRPTRVVALRANQASVIYTSGVARFAAVLMEKSYLSPFDVFRYETASFAGTLSGDVIDATVQGPLADDLGSYLPDGGTMRVTGTGVVLSGKTLPILGFGRIDVEGPVVMVGDRPTYDLGVKRPPGASEPGTVPGTITWGARSSYGLPTGMILLGETTVRGTVHVTDELALTVDFDGAINIPLLQLPVATLNGRITGSLKVFVGSAGRQTYGDGTIDGTIVPVGGAVTSFHTAWALNTDDLITGTPSDDIPIVGFFNTAPAFQNRSITSRAVAGDVVTLSGRITEPDRADKFILEVNWGDGTSDTYTFPRGSDGRLVEVTHRYGRPSPNGQPYRVTALWHDPHGAGNSAEFTVEVLPPQPASAKALRHAEKLGAVRELGVDLDGDGVSEVLVLDRTGRSDRLVLLSGADGRELARLDRRDAPEAIKFRDQNGRRVSLVIGWRHERGADVITFRDAAGDEVFLWVTFGPRDCD